MAWLPTPCPKHRWAPLRFTGQHRQAESIVEPTGFCYGIRTATNRLQGILRRPREARIRLIPLIGAGRFELPTPCAQGSFRPPPKMPYLQVFTFQGDTGIRLKPVEPCWTWKHRAATKLSTAPRTPDRRPALVRPRGPYRRPRRRPQDFGWAVAVQAERYGELRRLESRQVGWRLGSDDCLNGNV